MSRALSVLPLAALLLPLVNCGGSQHAVDEKYFLLATNTKLPYWQQAAAGFNQAANRMRVKAEVAGPDSYDPKAEETQLEQILKQKPAGILISAGDPAVVQAGIDAAIAQGVPVIAIDSDAPASKRLMFIGTDNYKAGLMGAKVVAGKLNGKGNVAVFTMPGQENLVDRLRGYKDAFAASPQIKIVNVVDIQGDPRVAFDKTQELLDQGAKIDAFVCLEAIACPEIADVLDRKKVTGKVVVAMDTDPRTLEGIQKGVISATIGQKPFTMAFLGLKLLDDLHHQPLSPLSANWSRDAFSPIPTFIDTGATLIDQSNVEQFIQAKNSATAK